MVHIAKRMKINHKFIINKTEITHKPKKLIRIHIKIHKTYVEIAFLAKMHKTINSLHAIYLKNNKSNFMNVCLRANLTCL